MVDRIAPATGEVSRSAATVRGVQRFPDGSVVVSATDLVGFLACDHLSTLELGRMEGFWERPHRREDLTVQLMQDRGDAHEVAHLERLRASAGGSSRSRRRDRRPPNTSVPPRPRRLDAMRDRRRRRLPGDLLRRPVARPRRLPVRVDRPSPCLRRLELRHRGYQAVARGQGSAILQMCVYAELLGRLQGIPPRIRLRRHRRWRRARAPLSDYFGLLPHASRPVSRRESSPEPCRGDHVPDPVDHCRVCVWYPTCIPADERRPPRRSSPACDGSTPSG